MRHRCVRRSRDKWGQRWCGRTWLGSRRLRTGARRRPRGARSAAPARRRVATAWRAAAARLAAQRTGPREGTGPGAHTFLACDARGIDRRLCTHDERHTRLRPPARAARRCRAAAAAAAGHAARGTSCAPVHATRGAAAARFEKARRLCCTGRRCPHDRGLPRGVTAKRLIVRPFPLAHQTDRSHMFRLRPFRRLYTGHARIHWCFATAHVCKSVSALPSLRPSELRFAIRLAGGRRYGGASSATDGARQLPHCTPDCIEPEPMRRAAASMLYQARVAEQRGARCGHHALHNAVAAVHAATAPEQECAPAWPSEDPHPRP